jgi:hypothetical protein
MKGEKLRLRAPPISRARVLAYYVLLHTHSPLSSSRHCSAINPRVGVLYLVGIRLSWSDII